MLLPKQEECIESSPPSFCVSALFIRFRSTLLHVVATMNIDAAQVLPVSDIQTPGLEKKALLRSLGPCPNQWNILFGFMHIRGLQPVAPFIGEGGSPALCILPGESMLLRHIWWKPAQKSRLHALLSAR
jgi:hypothetical protein